MIISHCILARYMSLENIPPIQCAFRSSESWKWAKWCGFWKVLKSTRCTWWAKQRSMDQPSIRAYLAVSWASLCSINWCLSRHPLGHFDASWCIFDLVPGWLWAHQPPAKRDENLSGQISSEGIRAWPDWRRSASRTQLWGELKIAVATADVYGYLPSRKWWLKKQNMFHQTFRIVQLPKYGELPKQETNCLLFFSHGPLCQFFPVYDLANRDGDGGVPNFRSPEKTPVFRNPIRSFRVPIWIVDVIVGERDYFHVESQGFDNWQLPNGELIGEAGSLSYLGPLRGLHMVRRNTSNQLIGLREHFQETLDFPTKNRFSGFNFPWTESIDQPDWAHKAQLAALKPRKYRDKRG